MQIHRPIGDAETEEHCGENDARISVDGIGAPDVRIRAPTRSRSWRRNRSGSSCLRLALLLRCSERRRVPDDGHGVGHGVVSRGILVKSGIGGAMHEARRVLGGVGSRAVVLAVVDPFVARVRMWMTPFGQRVGCVRTLMRPTC